MPHHAVEEAHDEQAYPARRRTLRGRSVVVSRHPRDGARAGSGLRRVHGRRRAQPIRVRPAPGGWCAQRRQQRPRRRFPRFRQHRSRPTSCGAETCLRRRCRPPGSLGRQVRAQDSGTRAGPFDLWPRADRRWHRHRDDLAQRDPPHCGRSYRRRCRHEVGTRPRSDASARPHAPGAHQLSRPFRRRHDLRRRNRRQFVAPWHADRPCSLAEHGYGNRRAIDLFAAVARRSVRCRSGRACTVRSDHTGNPETGARARARPPIPAFLPGPCLACCRPAPRASRRSLRSIAGGDSPGRPRTLAIPARRRRVLRQGFAPQTTAPCLDRCPTTAIRR